MDAATPNLREQGLQALRQGNLDGAIDLLARAVVTDNQDAEAQALLGIAYCQKGLHAQAKRALETAVELQPQNAQHRFNLGTALERAGDRQGAAAAYGEALRLNPEHAQAKARLQAMSSSPAAPVGGAAVPAAPAGVAGAGSAPWLGAGPPPGAPQQTVGPPGTVQCPHCQQWSRPGVDCEWCSSPLQNRPAPGAAPWLQSPAGPAPGYSGAENVSVSTAPEMGAGEAFARRFAAVFLDGIILAIIGSVLNQILIGRSMTPGTVPTPAALGSIFRTSFTVNLLLTAAYSGGMLAAYGRTLGKMALGLRVIGPDGGNPEFLRAVLRETVGKWVSSLILGLGYLWMLWDNEQQCWHDKIAGTFVERA